MGFVTNLDQVSFYLHFFRYQKIIRLMLFVICGVTCFGYNEGLEHTCSNHSLIISSIFTPYFLNLWSKPVVYKLSSRTCSRLSVAYSFKSTSVNSPYPMTGLLLGGSNKSMPKSVIQVYKPSSFTESHF